MARPNAAEAHLQVRAGSLKPLHVRDGGALYWVPGVEKYLVERKGGFIWTNDEELGLDMITPQMNAGAGCS